MYTIHNTYSYQDGFTTIEDAINHLVATTPEQDHFITNDLGNTTVAIYHQHTVFLPRAAAPDLLALLDEARQAIDWYLGLCNGFEGGETYGNHPDHDAYSYLKNEAIGIGLRIDAAIAAAKEATP